MAPQSQVLYLRRRLNKWQIFFIGLGGIVGIGFFRESSETLAIAGPIGALVAVVIVGIIATAVMECICELIVLWAIPNAMVEFVKAFIDKDLAVAVGIMYWYTYCVNFSALIIAVTDLAEYWHVNHVFKPLIFVLAPLSLIIVNAFPVSVFGWLELAGGIAKLCLILGTVILMFLINGGVSPDGVGIGIKYFSEGVTYNSEVAGASYQAVFEAIPLATFAYIGVELLTTTAFEARWPNQLRAPAATVGPLSTILYALVTGSFVANVSWQDQNLPKLFQQALTVVTDPQAASEFAQFSTSAPTMNSVPLIALYRAGYRFLPSFLNGCFIYSALSCANTALYVASRQLYGMTMTVTVDNNSGIIRRALRWISTVNYYTNAPWVAIAISGLILSWLPFIRIEQVNDIYLQDVQDALISIGSVSCILVWCSQCVAYIHFFHLRELHEAELRARSPTWDKLFEKKNRGFLNDLQPLWGYLGAFFTLLIVIFFNSVSLWNGKRISVKAVSAFVSPALILTIWVIKKLLRKDGRRFSFFVNLTDFGRFERCLQDLDALIYPGEPLRLDSCKSDLELQSISTEQREGRRISVDRNGYSNSGDEAAGLTHTSLVLVPNARQEETQIHSGTASQVGDTNDLVDSLSNLRSERLSEPNSQTFTLPLINLPGDSIGGTEQASEREWGSRFRRRGFE